MKKKNLRSQQWFDNPKDPEQTAIYLERYLNYGLTRKELQSGNPIIGIAQSGSDLTPCNRHFQSLSKRIKDGIRTKSVKNSIYDFLKFQNLGKKLNFFKNKKIDLKHKGFDITYIGVMALEILF